MNHPHLKKFKRQVKIGLLFGAVLFASRELWGPATFCSLMFGAIV